MIRKCRILVVIAILVLISGCASENALFSFKNENSGPKSNVNERRSSVSISINEHSVSASDANSLASMEKADHNEKSEDNKKKKREDYYPCEEIKKASFSDYLFQVNDQIFKFEFGMPLGKYIELFDPTLISFKEYKNKEYVDVNLNKLVSSPEGAHIHAFINGEDNYFMELGLMNKGKETVTLSELPLRSFNINTRFAGKIFAAKGIQINSGSPVFTDEDYSFGKIKETLEKITDITEKDYWLLGYEPKYSGKSVLLCSSDKLSYDIYAFASENICLIDKDNKFADKTWVDRPMYWIDFKIDKETGLCGEIRFNYFEESDWEDLD